MVDGTQQVIVVTDSTSDIPQDIATALNIEIVPLSVRFGDEVFLDRIEMSQAEFLERLKGSTELPKTSQPSTTMFEDVFRAAISADLDVVCVTIASNLSGTFNSARLAGEAVNADRIRVVDSQTVSMALGWAVIAAGRAANSGKSVEEVVSEANDALSRVHLYAVLETLDYAHRGGRIGRASHLIGSMLSIKPILTVRDGEVTPLERVRTWGKAIDRIAEIAKTLAPLEGLAVAHAGNPSDAQRVSDQLRDLVPPDQFVLSDVGPVIATYAGPGAVGIFPLAASS
jgi:fatty acid kinase fatty acid binding subunit